MKDVGEGSGVVIFMCLVDHVAQEEEDKFHIGQGLRVKTWQEEYTRRKCVATQGGKNVDLKEEEAEGMERREWIPEGTGSGVSLSGSMGKRGPTDSESAPFWVDGGDSTQERELRKKRWGFCS